MVKSFVNAQAKIKSWIGSNMHTSLLRSRSWALLSHFILAPFAQQIFIFKMTCKNICAVFEQKGRLKMIEISGYWPWKRCWRFIRTHHAELTSVLEICKSKFNGYEVVFLKIFLREELLWDACKIDSCSNLWIWKHEIDNF